jgi:RNA polymerase sigma-70 factor (TIGR02960 family)
VPVDDVQAPGETALVTALREGDEVAFEGLVTRHRRELFAHCYRLLGSPHDAEDALQESLVNAWRGLPDFQGRSSLRTWLYRIATNTCLRLIARRPRRLLSPDHGPARQDPSDLGEVVPGPVWLEPWPDDERVGDAGTGDPAARYLERESIELAFLAALQHLPGTQRAALILRDVLAFSAAETAQILDTTSASVNSALQRARKTVGQRVTGRSQRAELADLGSAGQRALVASFVHAWQNADVTALLDLLTEDAQFAMPPLPAWFHGKDDMRRFFAERMFAASWRLVPVMANGQLAFACYTREAAADVFRLGAINVVTVRAGKISQAMGFLDPAAHRPFGLPTELD